jgi:hypothetical protein
MKVRCPILVVPVHSGSTSVLVFQLGDLSIDNQLTHSVLHSTAKQKWDAIKVSLQQLQLYRGKLLMSGNPLPEHVILQPISLQLQFERALPPNHSDEYYILKGYLDKLNIALLQTDLKVIMGVLTQNLTEQGSLTFTNGKYKILTLK